MKITYYIWGCPGGGFLEIKNERLLVNLIKLIKYDAKIFGGVSDRFPNEEKQNDLIEYMEENMNIPDYYYLEMKDLFRTHGGEIIPLEEKVQINDLFKSNTCQYIKK